MAQADREARIRERAYQLWEEAGRPEGRAQDHWREAERQILAEGGASWQPEVPDDVQGSRGVPAADPLRNPELIPPALDPEYPAITGPEEVPDIRGARTSLNPGEIVGEPQPTPHPGQAAATAGTRKKGGAAAKTRKRQAGGTLEP
jgi:hypothetical protein